MFLSLLSALGQTDMIPSSEEKLYFFNLNLQNQVFISSPLDVLSYRHDLHTLCSHWLQGLCARGMKWQSAGSVTQRGSNHSVVSGTRERGLKMLVLILMSSVSVSGAFRVELHYEHSFGRNQVTNKQEILHTPTTTVFSRCGGLCEFSISLKKLM